MKDILYPREEPLQIWREAIDPEGIGMPEAIARDIGSLTGETVAEVLEAMKTGNQDFKRAWEAARIDLNNHQQIEESYANQFVEAYGLANWHAGTGKGPIPVSYAFAAQFAREQNLKRILDFGSGIGTGALVLARTGAEVHAADIATQLLKWVGHRLQLRGVNPVLFDMHQGEKPRVNFYDLITCFDVLEHVPDQAAKLREMEIYLSNGGYVLTNFMVDSSDPDKPMHISSAGHWDLLIRKTGLVAVWSHCDGYIQVLRKTSYARPRHLLASALDWLRNGAQPSSQR
jgi:2-polyprenyl-3-methyl-5-hydroxy-6-metoxy-1,4-benzoquinol methylase